MLEEGLANVKLKWLCLKCFPSSRITEQNDTLKSRNGNSFLFPFPYFYSHSHFHSQDIVIDTLIRTGIPLDPLSLSWKLPSVLEEHGTVRQCQPTSATSTSQIDVIQLLHAATATV